MADKKECACSSAPKLIFACSGAADVGAVADQAARKLSKDGVGKMFCAVGIGGRVPGILKSTEAAAKILAVDGCPLDCMKHSLELAGFTDYKHIRVTECGLDKGKTPVNESSINKVAEHCKTLLV